MVLPLRDGVVPSAKPPVRIFVGTEPGQHRAERVLVWSIEQVRDPGRVYEIYLMKDLLGFDRRRWLTGFTNYRFAIPHLGGGTGRAIYNDVDQVYLGDPAELFDIDMKGHGYLAISPQDTAVMLLDCGRMAAVWPGDVVCRERRKRIEALACAVPGLWGQLPREWHCRDWEYVPGRGTKVLHYTTIHTQPWRPFPDAFAYQSSPVGRLWDDREQAADRAGFQVFSAAHPSQEYRALVARWRGRSGASTEARAADRVQQVKSGTDAGDIDALLAQLEARTVLDYTFGSQSTADRLAWGGCAVSRYDPTRDGGGKLPVETFDAVLCTDGVERVPDDDVPWVVEVLFRQARRLVYMDIREERRSEVLPNGARLDIVPRGESWWSGHIARASARHPEAYCRLVFHRRGSVVRVREWGRRVEPPVLWILADDKAGHTTQSVGLAEALEWPYELRALRFNLLNRLSNHLLGATLVSLDRRRSAPLKPPWPDVVISTGRRSAPVARWIGAQSRGRTRLVQMGRKGSEISDAFDVAISCAHFCLPPHPRRIETVAPITAVTASRLAEAAERWQGLLGDAPRPHVVLVVGGTCAQHRLDGITARTLGAEVRAFAEAAGGSVFAITSPRTGPVATEALCVGLGSSERVHRWRKGERENPYLGYLALADALVVTGESESMLAEAAATTVPLYIYPLPERRPGFRVRLREWVARKAYSRPRKKKGTVRPQQGMEYYCARLIERGIVQATRDVAHLHENLIRRGVAHRFGGPLRTGRRAPFHEVDAVACRVRALLGFPDCGSGAASLGDGRGGRQAGVGTRVHFRQRIVRGRHRPSVSPCSESNTGLWMRRQ